MSEAECSNHVGVTIMTELDQRFYHPLIEPRDGTNMSRLRIEPQTALAGIGCSTKELANHCSQILIWLRTKYKYFSKSYDSACVTSPRACSLVKLGTRNVQYSVIQIVA